MSARRGRASGLTKPAIAACLALFIILSSLSGKEVKVKRLGDSQNGIAITEERRVFGIGLEVGEDEGAKSGRDINSEMRRRDRLIVEEVDLIPDSKLVPRHVVSGTSPTEG